LIGFVVLLALGLIAILADFLSPYPADEIHADFSSTPPVLTKIHLSDPETGDSGPFLYGSQKIRNPFTSKVEFKEDTSVKIPINFWVHSWSYKFLGIWISDLHLFGTAADSASLTGLFLFGTDKLGRDLFSRILTGTRLPLILGILVALFSIGFGVLVGGISGYFGGALDLALQRFTEAFMSLPRLALLLVLTAAVPIGWTPQYRFWGLVAAIAIVGWAPVARVVRGQVLSLREESYVAAAKVIGASSAHIIWKHLIPNTMSYLIVAATLIAANAVVLESTISFLGFGLQEPNVSWGLLLQSAKSIPELQLHPWVLLPGCFLATAVVAFNFLGDALRDAVDPRMAL
jgi:peptide/nickel transport system permease protein